mmetsp:Transcript_109072/g.315130  ORF Transcript_109072/g.315130 Transcript_109072/m.315130 type:complete len:426 (-) Transcript_109072:24-1301(-)
MRYSGLVFALLLQQIAIIGVASSAVSAPVPASPAPSQDSQGNPVVQLFGYVKDSLVRTVTGAKEMWGNHGRCKEIRSKQKDYREKLKSQWELQEKNLSQKEMRARLAAVNGGITYDEFMFLAKGKEDRSKLMNLVFLMWGAPRVLPYALMLYPNILPSPFAPLPDASGKETKLEKISRQRSHAVMTTLLELENSARQVPYLSKLNIFGKKAQERRMNSVDNLGRSLAEVLSTPAATGGTGAELLLDRLDGLLYKKGDEGFTRAEKRFIGVPGAIIVGLMNSINGPGFFNGVMPNFMRRGTVFAHVQKVTEADNFLVNEKVDLGILSTSQLLEACNDRMIGGCGRSDEELRQDLSDWLDLAVAKPTARTEQSGEEFNGNLARAALMGFYSLEAVRDPRCSSYLPRCLFQGQLVDSSPPTVEKTKKR